MTVPAPNIDRLIDAYRAGLDTAEAGALAGISRRTVDGWRASPQNDAQRAAAVRIEQAIAEYAEETLSAISASRAEDWRAAAWTMEHLPAFRDRYGQRVESDPLLHQEGAIRSLLTDGEEACPESADGSRGGSR